jgi:hypothetical protein
MYPFANFYHLLIADTHRDVHYFKRMLDKVFECWSLLDTDSLEFLKDLLKQTLELLHIKLSDIVQKLGHQLHYYLPHFLFGRENELCLSLMQLNVGIPLLDEILQLF